MSASAHFVGSSFHKNDVVTMASAAARLAARCVSRRPLLNPSISPIFVARRWLSSYPDHVVVGMPSLSPVRACSLALSIEEDPVSTEDRRVYILY